MEHADRILPGASLDLVERAVDDASATDFLPACMTEFMNLETTRSPNLASGMIFPLFGAMASGHVCFFELR